MTRQIFRHFASLLTVLGVALSTTLSLAQGGLASKFPGVRGLSPGSQAASHQKQTPGSPSYTYSLLSYPSFLSTVAICINKGAITSKTGVVGGYGPFGDYQAGFLARVSGTKTITETYQSVSYPHEPAGQWATCVNDLGQIVGQYYDSSGVGHGYERSGGKFTTLDVPFAGATGTFPQSINNSGEVVGCWADSADNSHGFTLTGSTYTSFDYPGGTQTCATDINSAGNIVGGCYNASGVGIGFLLNEGTFTPISFPDAAETSANGINDSGDIAGTYCPTSGECETNSDGAQGFLLSGGTFTAVTIPGEVYTDVTDINNDGVLVGYYQDAAGLVVSFLASP
jgi:hypothetical protein